ncbi:MAG: hypothetical protein LBI05_05735, partial [Planctomycetaceae bacterium]|nr:hypothetical protein [Planctomycetaceae bacterium]
ETVVFPLFGEKLGDMNIVDLKTTDRQLILKAIPQNAGKTPIWAMTIQCGEQQIVIPSTEIDIATSIDSTNASLDQIGLSSEPLPESYWYFYALIAATVFALLLFLWRYYRHRPDVPVEISPLSAQEIALRRLAELLESRKHESDVKGFFVELSDIVRWYVERLTGIHAPELTTEEFLHKIAEPTRWYTNKNEQQSTRFTGSLDTLASFLTAADVVKFAKHVPTNEEIMHAFHRAEDFVRRSQEGGIDSLPATI